MSEESPQVAAPKGAKSPLWMHFGFLVDEKGMPVDSKAVAILCKLCPNLKRVAFSGNTTNLKQHLANHHLNELAEIVGESSSYGKPKLAQAKLEEFSSVSVKPLPSGSKRAQAIIRAIAELVARDLRPIAIVEGNGFRRMMAILEPQYRVPSRKHVTKILHDIYAEVKSVVESELSMVADVALTCDFWTSRASDAYLGVTAHYITPTWELKSRSLQTREVKECHTVENVAAELTHMVEEWGLQEKVVAISRDNAANMVAAMRIIPWMGLPCFAHTLQIAV